MEIKEIHEQSRQILNESSHHASNEKMSYGFEEYQNQIQIQSNNVDDVSPFSKSIFVEATYAFGQVVCKIPRLSEEYYDPNNSYYTVNVSLNGP